MKTTIRITGGESVNAMFSRINDEARATERAGIVAACAVMSNACKAASPGSIKNECGFRIRQKGQTFEGRAGLMKFPRRNQRGRGPHGVYLEHGTKFITPRRFIAQALRSSRPRAIAAMRKTIKARIRRAMQT